MNSQKDKMKWILFWVFLVLFIIMVLCTLSMVFLGFGSPTAEERSLLVKGLIGEVAACVVALFYSIFGINKNQDLEVEIKNDQIQEIISNIENVEKRMSKFENVGSNYEKIDKQSEGDSDKVSILSYVDDAIENYSFPPPFPIEEFKTSPLPKEIEKDLSDTKPFDLKHREESYQGTKIQWKAIFSSIYRAEKNLYRIHAKVGFMHTLIFEINEEVSHKFRHINAGVPFWVCGEITEVESMRITIKNAHISF